MDLDTLVADADPRMRCWLLLAAYTGLRCFEIVGLRRDAILDRNDPPLLMVEDGKGGHQRMIPLHPLVIDALRAYGMPPAGFLFRLRDGRPLSSDTLGSYVGQFCRARGVPITAHRLRHWFGSELYRRTHDLRLCQEMLGHSSPNTTAGYTAWSPSAASDAVLHLHDR